MLAENICAWAASYERFEDLRIDHWRHVSSRSFIRLCWALWFGDCAWTPSGERNTITRHLAWVCPFCLLLVSFGGVELSVDANAFGWF